MRHKGCIKGKLGSCDYRLPLPVLLPLPPLLLLLLLLLMTYRR
jgi:hypothetical protein